MSKIVSILNPKGGAGKTTIALNLAGELAKNSKVVLVDTDQQGSALDWYSLAEGKSAFNVIGLSQKEQINDMELYISNFDWVVIDGAAKSEKITVAAVKKSELVLIPIQPSPVDLWAVADIVDIIHSRQTITDGIPRAAFIINRAKKGTELAKEIADGAAKYDLPVLDCRIHDRTNFAKTMIDGGLVCDSVQKDDPAAYEIRQLTKAVREVFE